jgi:hypothetical protein
MSWRLAVAGLLALGACAQIGAGGEVSPEDLEWRALSASYNRAFGQSFTEEPFELGSLSVIAEEGSELSTYNFFPCQGGQAVCSGGLNGQAGRISRTPSYFVLTGLHGRTFWFSYGGDGWVEQNEQFVPMAWNARRNGTGDGSEPALETPFPH